MGSDDDIIIRNGTLRNWLSYTVVFGGTPAPGDRYGRIEGGRRVKGCWIVGGLLLALLVAAWI